MVLPVLGHCHNNIVKCVIYNRFNVIRDEGRYMGQSRRVPPSNLRGEDRTPGPNRNVIGLRRKPLYLHPDPYKRTPRHHCTVHPFC